jgi:K+-sensing histidine kinase KdpD
MGRRDTRPCSLAFNFVRGQIQGSARQGRIGLSRRCASRVDSESKVLDDFDFKEMVAHCAAGNAAGKIIIDRKRKPRIWKLRQAVDSEWYRLDLSEFVQMNMTLFQTCQPSGWRPSPVYIEEGDSNVRDENKR